MADLTGASNGPGRYQGTMGAAAPFRYRVLDAIPG
jgi:hypothetical protein